MSGIDLWGDDFGAGDTTVEMPPLHIHVIAASEHEALWRNGLEEHGVRLVAADDAECQLILVDERCPDYEQRLAALSRSDDGRRPLIFFLVTNGAEPDCMRAFSCGADDYVHLPISPEALAARLKRVEVQLRDTSSMREQLSQSSQIAFQSMTMNAELGRILQYMEYSFACEDFAALAKLTLNVFNDFGLHASMGISHDRGMAFFFDDNLHRPIEQEVLENSRQLGRISDFGSRTILNYAHVSVLVRNMPLEDPLRYGTLKDHICYIANGLEARTLAMINELRSQERAIRIQTTANVLQQMIADMEQAKLEVTSRSTEELQTMLETLNVEFSQLCLTGREEERLMSLLADSSDRIHTLFRSAAEQDQLFQQLLSSVAQTLER
jgi:CheY-like chemotaxis protein